MPPSVGPVCTGEASHNQFRSHPLEVPVLSPRLREGNAKELTETPAALMPGSTAAAVAAVDAPHGSEMSHTISTSVPERPFKL